MFGSLKLFWSNELKILLLKTEDPRECVCFDLGHKQKYLQQIYSTGDKLLVDLKFQVTDEHA